MCYGMSTGAVRWLAYEIVDRNNIKDKLVHWNNVGFLDISAILTINVLLISIFNFCFIV